MNAFSRQCFNPFGVIYISLNNTALHLQEINMVQKEVSHT